MSTVFTDFVRQMDPQGPGPSHELVEQVWEALRGLLVSELKRRSSWLSPPSYLGIIGHRFWTTPETGSDALDELASQCFEFVFVQRLSSFRDQARRKETVDGLVALANRHFLLETQRKNDPLGFRVFEVLRGVMRRAIASEQLFLLAGDHRVRNDSLLARSPATPPVGVLPSDLQPLAERWVDDHLEGLFTASRNDLARLRERLIDELLEWLDQQDLPGFRFGDLAASVKQRARLAWAARFLDSSFLAQPVDRNSVSTPLDESDTLQRFTMLVRCVSDGIAKLGERAKTLRYLDRLWRFLETFALDGGTVEILDGLTDPLDLPPQRQISKLLEIPRGRIPGLLEILREQVHSCREKVEDVGKGVSLAARKENHDRLAEARAAALAAARDAAKPPPQNLDGKAWWRAGDIVSFPAADRLGVYWLLLEVDSQSDPFRCAVVDTFPLLGPDDLELSPASGSGAWRLRCNFELTLESRVLGRAQWVDRIEDEVLRAALAGATDDGLLREDQDSPEYRDWIDDGPRRAKQLLSGQPLPYRSPSKLGTWPRFAWVLAASLFLAVIGLAIDRYRLGRLVERLSQPILDLPYREIQLSGFRGERALEIPADATHVELGLILDQPLDHEMYLIELLKPDGTMLFRSPDLAAQSSYTLTFPVAQQQRSIFRVRIFGIDDQTQTLIDKKTIELVRSESP